MHSQVKSGLNGGVFLIMSKKEQIGIRMKQVYIIYRREGRKCEWKLRREGMRKQMLKWEEN